MKLKEFLAINGSRATAEKLVNLRIQNVIGLSMEDLPDSAALWDIVEDVEAELIQNNFSIEKIKDILKEINFELIEGVCW